MKKHVITISFSLVFIGALSTLFLKVITSSNLDQQFFLNKIGEIKQNNSELNESILKSYFGITKHYDEVVQISKKLETNVNMLLSLSNSHDHKQDMLSSQLKSVVQKKIRSIERFKSQNSVFQNSRIYFLTTNEGLFQDSYKYTEPVFKQDLLNINWKGYALIKNKQEVFLLNLQEAIKTFKKKHAPKYPLNEKLEALSIHGEIFLRTELATAKNLQTATTNEINTIATKMVGQFLSHQDIIRDNNIIYQTAMMILSLLLFIYTVTIFVKLIKTMENLETRVKERTKELEESHELVKSQEKSLFLSSKMSALGEMAGGVAHEINNPLAIISLSCKVLKKAIKSKDTNPTFIEDQINGIEATSQRIAKIIKSLRTFSRSEQCRDLTMTTIKEVIDDTLSLCEEKFRIKDVRIIKCLEDDEKEFLCNPVTISQVILNLLSNSFDAIESEATKWIQIESHIRNETIEISVTDCGNGIPKDIVLKMMDPFFTSKEIGKGTGLGLSISKGIIESHGGQLIYDNDSKNTKFTIRFPLKLTSNSLAS